MKFTTVLQIFGLVSGIAVVDGVNERNRESGQAWG
jgi:hypothetical protein